MGNIFQTILKYGQYLPILAGLVNTIRSAEKKFKELKGSERLQWAESQFRSLVGMAQASGLIKAKLADALRNGAAAIISVVVQAINEQEGTVPPADTMPDDAADFGATSNV